MSTPDTYIGGANWNLNGINWNSGGSEVQANVEPKQIDAISHRFPTVIISATLAVETLIFPLLSPTTDNRINQAQSTTRYVSSQTPSISRTLTKQGKVWEVSGDEALSLQSIVRVLEPEFIGEDTNDLDKKFGYDFQAWAYNDILEIGNRFEVMALSDELNRLAQDLHDLTKKLDEKADKVEAKFEAQLEKLDSRFDKLESKIDKLADKVSAISTDVVEIKTTIKVQNSWREKLQIPIIVGVTVGFVMAIVNHLSDIFRLFVH